MERKRVGLTWQLTSISGWGVYGIQLVANLYLRYGLLPTLFHGLEHVGDHPLLSGVFAHVAAAQREAAAFLAQRNDRIVRAPFPVLHALGNQLAGSPVSGAVQGQPDHALIFFEDTALSQEARLRARRFATIVAGSSWNAEVLRDAGIENVEVGLQGVDPTIFHPAPRSGLFGDRFVVFSGGKLEFRKGQDLVIETFRRFRQRHPEALLLTAWFNPWPDLTASIAHSPWIKGPPRLDERTQVCRHEWFEAHGLPAEAVRIIGSIPNVAMAQVMREADVALFLNRCEGGTNLVAMECLACGVPTVLSANTGHLDLVRGVPCHALSRQSPVPPGAETGTEGWGESDIEEALAALEAVHADRAAAAAMGRAAAEAMGDWSWARRIDHLAAILGITGRENF
jgi:glycosyltransferase involved in cell wall biosynthesis